LKDESLENSKLIDYIHFAYDEKLKP